MTKKKTLEEEAAEFKTKRNRPELVTDKEALRYYMGCALSGLLAAGGHKTNPEEILQMAYRYAILADKLDKTF